MGYDINTAPPRPWFCGHVYLKEAKRILDSVRSEGRTVRDVAICMGARLNIMRGIRVAVQLVPENYAGKDILWGGLDGRIEPERLKALKNAYFREFRHSIGGTGQYGVPNFLIRDKANPGLSASATEHEGQILATELVAERLAAAKDLMNLAIEIFFWDVYVPEKQHDIHYYDLREGMDSEAILEALVNLGFAKNNDDAKLRWGKQVEDDPFNLGEDVDLAFRKWNEEIFWEIVNDDFWGWSEDQSIYHSFSD